MNKQTMLDSFCPNCNGQIQYIKKWKLRGRGEHETWLYLYKCQKCGATLRVPKREK